MEIVIKGIDVMAGDGQLTLIRVSHDILDDQGVPLKDGAGRILNFTTTFPSDTLEWRSAEYGIEDSDILLDIVLHEQWLPPGDSDSPDLFMAPDIETARASHLGKIDNFRGKSRTKKESAEQSEMRRQIKGLCIINPEAVEVKREYVSRVRDSFVERRTRRNALIAKTGMVDQEEESRRVEMLRKRLAGKNKEF